MRIRNRIASLAYKGAIVAIGGVALAHKAGLGSRRKQPRFWYYFTHISNVAAVAYYSLDIAKIARNRDQAESPVWAARPKHAVMMGLTVTCLVAYFLIEGGLREEGGSYSADLLALHFIVPLGSVLDWLLFDEKRTMDAIEPLEWTVFPLAYFAYTLFLVNVLGIRMGGVKSRYPYPFIDVDKLGVKRVVGTVAALLAAFVTLGYGFVGIDHLLARPESPHGNRSNTTITPKEATGTR